MEKQVFTFGLQISQIYLIAIIIAIPVLVFISYMLVVIKIEMRDKLILATLRILTLYLVFVCILQPVIRGKKLNEAYMAVMIDTSKSMDIEDCNGGKKRFDIAKKLLEGDLPKELEKTFKNNTLKYYSFDESAKPMKDIASLSATGERTDLVRSINTAVEDLQGVPLSGVVVITDGVDNVNPQNEITQMAYALREKAVPIYFVGIGSEVKLKDLQVVDISGPDTVEEKQPVNLNITFSSQGYPAKSIPVSVYEDDKLIKKFDQNFQADTNTVSKFSYTPATAGLKRIKIEVPIDDDEFVKDNNSSFVTVNIA